ncbi:cell surface glycoprotein CD200 receptor 1 isoform X1 [Equus przewalskii]|uniref:Cell surface glycoprotein CD200 receptor 1 isoform X1 n=1 Tax=Equus przewalskii TaxID=9798 RepID=A0ABM4LC86_EQUPR|nr:PREDICTED: cell surface glycoprotein CD200 receptor 1 isoform X1 [Equus przewalskii]
MLCTWRTSDLRLLLTLIVFLVVECISARGQSLNTTSNSSMQQTGKGNYSSASVNGSSTDKRQRKLELPAEANASLSVPVDTKAVFDCPSILLTSLVVTTWQIILRDKLSCTRAYRRDRNETKEGNCTDERITWASRPDENLALQIDPVATTHDGFYMCQMVTPDGNFHRGYHLQVLVPPEVTLLQSKNGTAVCRAAAGKPAAQISWNPEGDCVTEQEHWANGTVTVQSTCRWEDHPLSNVSCSVSHVTGNKSLSLELTQGAQTTANLHFLYIIPCIFIVFVIGGSIWLLKNSGCRKCKLKKTEANPGVEEDEMQPYASYTEKNNPLYDTTNKERCRMLQSEVDGIGLDTL